MNDGINTIQMTFNFMEKELGGKAIVMFPGDKWVIGSTHNNLDVPEKWSKDYHSLQTTKYIKTDDIPFDESKPQARNFGQLLFDSFPRNKKAMIALKNACFF